MCAGVRGLDSLQGITKRPLHETEDEASEAKGTPGCWRCQNHGMTIEDMHNVVMTQSQCAHFRPGGSSLLNSFVAKVIPL